MIEIEEIMRVLPHRYPFLLVDRVLERHPDDRMARTVAVCSVLVGDRPVRSQDPAAVSVAPGSVVELLPPFAGG